MLEVLETREGTYEVSDQFLNEDRNRVRLFKNVTIQSSATILGLIVILLLFTLFTSFNLDLSIKLILILLILAISSTSYLGITKLNSELDGRISGFLLVFNDQKELIILRVRNWVRNSFDEYLETDVRFNQSIGFKAIIQEEGDLEVEIIVDPNFPGTTIFLTYDVYSLAEIILLFEKVLPNQNQWYYFDTNGVEWGEELREELNRAIQESKVPLVLRQFYGLR